MSTYERAGTHRQDAVVGTKVTGKEGSIWACFLFSSSTFASIFPASTYVIDCDKRILPRLSYAGSLNTESSADIVRR